MTKTLWVCLVVHGCMHAIWLYRVIGVIRVMASHLKVVYGGGMVDSVCDCVCGMSVNVSCSDGVGGRYIYMHSNGYMHSDMFRSCCVM